MEKTLKMSSVQVERLLCHLEKAVLTYETHSLRLDALSLMKLVKDQTGIDLDNDVMPLPGHVSILKQKLTSKKLTPEDKLELLRTKE